MLDNERILKMEAEIQSLRLKVSQLEFKTQFLTKELKVCHRSFCHHGLDGHAWIVDQVLIMAGDK